MTVQPIFSYGNLIEAMFSGASKNNHLMLNSARSSLYLAIDALLKNNLAVKQVLLPDLICSEIIPIIRMFDISIKFYNVDKDLDPDINSIRDQIKNKLSIVLIVNYFGFPSNWSEIHKLKNSDNCIIIEDNAHSLYGKYDNQFFGNLGDISFNSLRKVLPVLSGSILKFNNSIKSDIKLKKRLVSYSEFKYSLRFLRRNVKANIQKPLNNHDYNDIESIDYFSKKIFISSLSDQNNISMKRKKNYNIWKKYLASSDLEMIKPNTSDCPYALPCIFENQKLYEKWVKWGVTNNVNLIRWPSLPNMESHKLNYTKLSNIILFPVNHMIKLDFLESSL